jgi:hypothetical protein
MKSIFPILAFSSVLLFGMNCSTSKKTALITPGDMTYTIIKSGNMFGAGEEGLAAGIIAASNTVEMNFLINKMNGVNEEIKESLISDVNFFDEYMLVFIFDKVRGSGGHSLDIKNISNTGKDIIVTVKEIAPNGPASTVMTQPYVVLKVIKSSLPLLLNITEL